MHVFYFDSSDLDVTVSRVSPALHENLVDSVTIAFVPLRLPARLPIKTEIRGISLKYTCFIEELGLTVSAELQTPLKHEGPP